MDFKRLLAEPRLLRAMTTLNADEFRALLPGFERVWHNAQRTALTRLGTERKRTASDTGALADIELKLLFILVYYKCYPTQDVMGFWFGVDQAAANRWVHRLTPVLELVLKRKMALPARRGRNLAKLLAETPGLSFLLDGTERPVRRPKAATPQKERYSGKKKRHTVKNVVVVELRTGKVLGLTDTVGGRRHDKALTDEAQIEWPKGSVLLGDSGFQGYTPPGTHVAIPLKRPSGGELDSGAKAANTALSKVRVRVEHAIGGIKRCGIVSTVHRNYKHGFADRSMLVACGLHNLRVAARRAV